VFLSRCPAPQLAFCIRKPQHAFGIVVNPCVFIAVPRTAARILHSKTATCLWHRCESLCFYRGAPHRTSHFAFENRNMPLASLRILVFVSRCPAPLLAFCNRKSQQVFHIFVRPRVLIVVPKPRVGDYMPPGTTCPQVVPHPASKSCRTRSGHACGHTVLHLNLRGVLDGHLRTRSGHTCRLCVLHLNLAGHGCRPLWSI
jgi:hypothetical protein